MNSHAPDALASSESAASLPGLPMNGKETEADKSARAESRNGSVERSSGAAPAGLDPAALIVIERELLRRLCCSRLRHELEGEIVATVWQLASEPRGVDRPECLSKALIPRLAGRIRRHERRMRAVGPEYLAALPARESGVRPDANRRVMVNLDDLRGSRQRRIVRAVLHGETIADVAIELATPVAELQRVVRRLLATLRRRHTKRQCW